MWWYPRASEGYKQGLFKDCCGLVAEDVQDFIRDRHRMPKDLAELGQEQFINAYDPEFYIDPRSIAEAACVWMRPRMTIERDWTIGCTQSWLERGTKPLDPRTLPERMRAAAAARGSG